MDVGVWGAFSDCFIWWLRILVQRVKRVKRVKRDVIKQLVVLYKESHLGQGTPAYDGMKSIYTAGPLPFESKEFLVKLP